MIDRILRSKADKLLQKYPVIAITGPRQSGKTTLSRLLRPDFKYVNLELLENRSFAEDDPKGFLKTYQSGAILDEVQYVPSLFPYIKDLTDKKNAVGEYILTGSQHFLLLEKITQSLAGRVAILQLLPLSFQELQNAPYIPEEPEDFIWKGGYPRLFNQQIDPTDFYPSYIQTYVERDVRQIINVNDLRLFRQFIAACGGRIGPLVNFSDLSNILGVDHKTVKSWIGILEASYIVFLLPSYHRNFEKRIVKSPKLYFYDTGLACSLLNISSAEQLNTNFAKGGLFENMIIQELLKNVYNSGNRPDFYFWRDHNQREIDLLFERNGKITALEIKAGKTINNRFLKNLYAFREIAGEDLTNLFCIYGGEEAQYRSTISILPWKRLDQVMT
jgi:hypothetical protein